MLDSSSGDWSKYYTTGAEATWVNRIKTEDFYLRYLGKFSRFQAFNILLNRMLNSRFQNLIWKYQRFFGWKSKARGHLITDSIIQLEVGEIWSNITAKTIAALDFTLQNFEFDFIIRGNSSLYIDPSLLEEFLEANLNQVDYAGPVIGEKKFVAGWCIILSRRAAQIVVDDFRRSDSYYFDDEAIGLILARNRIAIHPLKFLLFDRLPNLFEVKDAIAKGNWIWRFKTDASGSRISAPAMKFVENISSQLGESS